MQIQEFDEDIFQISSSDDNGEEDQAENDAFVIDEEDSSESSKPDDIQPEAKNINKKPQEAAWITNKRSEDNSEKLEILRNQYDQRLQSMQIEFENMKRRHTEKLTSSKHNNITKEQAYSNGNDLEFRNMIWALTLHHFGKGSFAEDLDPLFQRSLSDEQYKLEKELLTLQQEYDDQISDMQRRQYYRKTKKRKITLPDPRELAVKLYRNMKGNDCSDVNNEFIDDLIRHVKKENNKIIDKDIPPRQAPVRNHHFNEVQNRPIKHRYVEPEKFVPKQKRSIQPLTESIVKQHIKKAKNELQYDLQYHIKERERLKKCLKQTDRFIGNLRKEVY